MKYTTDLWFSSFLLMRGQPLAKFEKSNNKLKLFFDLNEEEWAKWKFEFSKSEVADCKMQQEKLKDLLY